MGRFRGLIVLTHKKTPPGTAIPRGKVKPQESSNNKMSNTNTATEKLSTCNCAEVFIDDIVDVKQPNGKMKQETTKRRLPFSQYHNCEYVRQRNGYVAQAAIFAQEKLEASNDLKPESRSAAFNSIFSQKMEELCQHITK